MPKKQPKIITSIALEPEVREQLAELQQAEDRSRSYIVNELIKQAWERHQHRQRHAVSGLFDNQAVA